MVRVLRFRVEVRYELRSRVLAVVLLLVEIEGMGIPPASFEELRTNSVEISQSQLQSQTTASCKFEKSFVTIWGSLET